MQTYCERKKIHGTVPLTAKNSKGFLLLLQKSFAKSVVPFNYSFVMTSRVNPSSMERIYIFPTSCLNDITKMYSPMKRKVTMSP